MWRVLHFNLIKKNFYKKKQQIPQIIESGHSFSPFFFWKLYYHFLRVIKRR